MSKRNIILVLLITSLVVSGYNLYQKRYVVQFHYLMWRSANYSEPMLFYYSDKIENIAPYVLPQLIEKYGDVNTSSAQRAFIGIGIIKADRNKAIELFIKYLTSSNDDIISHSIYNLAELNDQSQYKNILKFVDSPSWDVRQAVVRYLKNIDNETAIVVLNEMMTNDSDEQIREFAKEAILFRNKME